MDFHKIKTIIRKEWAEVFKRRIVLFTVSILPLIITAMPLIILYTSRGEVNSSDLVGDMPNQFQSACPSNLTSGECFQTFIINQFMVMFMILPLAIPATIAAYSIVGEKTTRSLEPLLATPITTLELLAGKGLSASIPAVLVTYFAFGLLVIGSWLMLSPAVLVSTILSSTWLLAVLLIGPLLSILSVFISMMVSSRVNDPRAAEQLSMIVIVPILALFFGQIAGWFFLNTKLILISALAILAVDIILLYFLRIIFDRETILTRWK